MTAVTSVEVEPSLGFKARKIRVSQLLTQQELATIAGVSQEDVSLLENNMPLRLEAKCKIFKELWARQAGRR